MLVFAAATNPTLREVLMKRRSICAVLIALLAVSAYSFKLSSGAAPAPQQQTLTIPGLRAPVTVRRDERGIPYIEAANDADLYFAQGYITAGDRLWQMDLVRRNVRGELAEIFGSAALDEDKRHRTLGFGQVVDETAKHLPPNLNASMTAYANGVNGFIDSLTDQTTPPEFRLLQYKPRHWTPADSLCVGKLLAEYLSNSWQLDVMRGAMMSLPKEKREALLPETSPLDVLVVGSDRAGTQASRLQHAPASGLPYSAELLNELTVSFESESASFGRLGLETFQASNNWVVSGKHTASGKPLLANDPHIPAAAPGVWYQVELTAPGVHVAGVTFPGAAGIVLGHNDFIAWGATNLGPDVQDVYIEKFDKENPNRYLTPSGWREAEIRHEQINVRKNPIDPKSVAAQNFDVTVTRHGPIVLEKDGVRYALKWPALDATTLESAGLFDANRAHNWKEFTEAMSHYTGPTQNFVYADVQGHIGYYGAGKIPIRKSGDGSIPYDGSTDDGEWTSYIPFDKLPHSFDPPSGIIVTANQRVIGRDYPYFLSHNWAPPYRARRIFDLLSAKPKLTTDDFRTIQGDTYSIAGVTFARAAAKTLKSEPAPGSSPRAGNTKVTEADQAIALAQQKFPALQGMRRLPANGTIGMSSNVFVIDQPNGWNLVFWKGDGDCLAGCMNNHDWYVSVTRSGDVTLVGEWESRFVAETNTMKTSGQPLWGRPRNIPAALPGAADNKLDQLINELESWDGMMNADSRTAAIVSQMRGAFRIRILNAALGPDMARNYTWAMAETLIDRIATEQPREWLPKEFSSYADLFRASYEDARQNLTKSMGADESQWTWGKIAIARFPHPLAVVPLVGAQFAIPAFPQNGSGGSINVGSSVSMRLIADPSDWDKTLNGIPLGESGVPSNPHWKDQLDDWRKVTPRALPFGKSAVENATRETVVLAPK
jgi:acyl-homoserine lactone acylase PvdQ